MGDAPTDAIRLLGAELNELNSGLGGIPEGIPEDVLDWAGVVGSAFAGAVGLGGMVGSGLDGTVDSGLDGLIGILLSGFVGLDGMVGSGLDGIVGSGLDGALGLDGICDSGLDGTFGLDGTEGLGGIAGLGKPVTIKPLEMEGLVGITGGFPTFSGLGGGEDVFITTVGFSSFGGPFRYKSEY